LRPISIKRIAFQNFESRLPTPAFAKLANQRLIEFDRANAIRTSEQPFGQRALSRADLQSQSGVIAASGDSDPLQNLTADEKVLSEFLTRQFCGSSLPD
jgi:hypothetical protein